MRNGFIAAWGIMSLVAFCLYGADKSKAKRGAWRISEKKLLLAAALLGAPGALAGMELFRHKTKHTRFRILVPLFLIAQVALFALIWRWTA